jgi:putative hydrolase of the HAD superfamily
MVTKIDLSQFDNIIFDFGGVIIDINPELTKQAFTDIYEKNTVDKLFSEKLAQKFESGLINFNEFFSLVEDIACKTVSKKEFIDAWCKMLLNYHPERINKIKQLRKTHKLFLLSNTNQTHFDSFNNKLKREYNCYLHDLFDNLFLSHKMKMLKPDIEIFEEVIKKENLIPQKTLFIEDTEENAIVAQQLNIKTLIIKRNSNFYDYIGKL